MTEYYPLIARAVEGLAKNTGEARRALYERAREALVSQLRAAEPALAEMEITKERLTLEEAIRKVEAEAARKALAEPRTQIRAESKFELQHERLGAAGEPPLRRRTEVGPVLPPHTQPNTEQSVQIERPRFATRQSARSRILEARTSLLKQEGFRAFGGVMNEVDRVGTAMELPARDLRDSHLDLSRQHSADAEGATEGSTVEDQLEPRFASELRHGGVGSLQVQGLESPYRVEHEQPDRPSRPGRPQPPTSMDFGENNEDLRPQHLPRFHRRWVKVALFVVLVAAFAAAAWQYRSGISQFLTQMKSPQASQTAQAPPPQTKFSERVPQEKIPEASAAAPAGEPQPAAIVAQRAVLYEADPSEPQGKRSPGSVIWRTETVSPGPGLAPELAIRADIAIPERHMKITWSLRRNTDKALPASHTIEIMFNLPADFPSGGIAKVPGILMKDSEAVRGMPLAGLAVKVTNGFFLIGLNAADDDVQRNLQLLKERSWFDILLVYTNGDRAILTLEKGPPGDRAFAEAFSAWGQ